MAQAMPPQTDPLEQLKDIHLPGGISLWPAPGWWLLGLLGLAVTSWGCYRLFRYWQANRYRSIAGKELNSIYSRYQESPDNRIFMLELQSLLKRVALHAYHRDKVAALSGELWVDFLDKSCGSNEFRMGAGQALIDSIYTRELEADIDQLLNLGHFWIKKHRKMDEHAGVSP